MARPRGSVKKQKDGRWVARYSAGDDPITGKRVQRWKTFETKIEAEQWRTAELSALDAGERQRRMSGGPTLAEYLRDFYTNDLRGLKGRMLSPRTADIDLEVVERYVVRRAPAVANTPLSKLATEQFAKLFRLLATGDDDHQPLARATVARVYRILTARLTHATKLRLLRANPLRTDLVIIDGKPPREQATLSPVQAQAFLVLSPTERYGVLFALCAWTGVRPGEAVGILWADVDFEAGVVTIRRGLVRRTGNVELRSTKTERARRVPIPPDLVAQLRAHRARQAKERLAAGPQYEDQGLVFATRYGRPEHTDNIVRRHLKPFLVRVAYHLVGKKAPQVPAPSRSAAYKGARAERETADAAALKEAGLSLRGLYGLRHTQATLLLQRNVHPRIVADRLGHSRTSTTLDQYSHVTNDMQAGVVDELQHVLGVKRAAGGQ